MFQLTCDVLGSAGTTQSSERAEPAVTQLVYTKASQAHIFTCSEQLNLFIMKATNIESVTWNYLGKPNCVLIEYVDGSSLMLPNGLDEETEKLVDGIIRRWHLARTFDFI